MKYIEVIADKGSADTISAIADKANASDIRYGSVDENGMQTLRLLVADDKERAIVRFAKGGIVCLERDPETRAWAVRWVATPALIP